MTSHSESQDAFRRNLIRAPREKRLFVVALVAIVLLAAGLRLYELDSKSLWSDEGATWTNSQDDLAHILAGQDAKHPPGYYALVHYSTTTFGDSETSLRAPSVLGSLIALIFTALTARRLWGVRQGLIAALVLLLSPLDLWYAQDARQAALAGMFVALFAYAFIRRDLVGTILGVVALPLGLYLDFVVIAGWMGLLGLYVFPWRFRTKRNVVEMTAITLVGFAIFIPLEGGRFWSGFASLLVQTGPNIWYGSVLGNNPITSSPIGILAFIAIGGFVTAALANKSFTGKNRAFFTYLGLVCLAIFLVAPAIDRAYSVKRIVVVGSPLIAGLGAYLITRLHPLTSRLWGGGLAALAIVSLVVTIRLPKDDWRSAVAFVNSNAETGDIAFSDDVPWIGGVYDFYGGNIPLFLTDDPPTAGRLIAEASTSWVLTRRRPQDAIPAIAAEKWFDENKSLLSEETFHRMAVRSYGS